VRCCRVRFRESPRTRARAPETSEGCEASAGSRPSRTPFTVEAGVLGYAPSPLRNSLCGCAVASSTGHLLKRSNFAKTLALQASNFPLHKIGVLVFVLFTTPAISFSDFDLDLEVLSYFWACF
jgi:hypothetical protein